MHSVYGESASKFLILGACLGGTLMAAIAIWLSQEIVLAPAQPISPASPTPVSVTVSAAVKVPDSPAAVVALPASSPTVVRDSRPPCPASLSVYFPSGAVAPLSAEGRNELELITDWALQHATAKIAVEGHADAVGVDDSNMLLSYQRAKVVVAMLERRGVLAPQLQLAATGSHGLIEGLPGNDHGNRRVTVQINDPDNCRSEKP